jgi:alkyl sulfatase BDS1-like metallo-beta-lactamase superfamily hydrolase
VQRYPDEWAAALREMAALAPELLLPGHGLPVAGAADVRMVLEDTATMLETLVEQTLVLMNEGARLDDVLHTVKAPDELLAKPYLQPIYDEPEFIVRNTWRLYGGWYDGNPARLHPAPDAVVAGEVRLAAQLVEWAAQAAPDDGAVQSARSEIYGRKRKEATSTMARGIYRWAEQESSTGSAGGTGS